MTVTLTDIQNAREILSRLANTDMPIKTSYELSKLIKQLSSEYNSIEEFRTSLVQKYGKQEGDNIKVIPGSEEFNSFMEEYMEFMSVEVELQASPIDIDINKTNIQVKPLDIIAIEKFVNFVGIPSEVQE